MGPLSPAFRSMVSFYQAIIGFFPSISCFVFGISFFRRNELARKVAKEFLLDLQSGTLDL